MYIWANHVEAGDDAPSGPKVNFFRFELNVSFITSIGVMCIMQWLICMDMIFLSLFAGCSICCNAFSSEYSAFTRRNPGTVSLVHSLVQCQLSANYC